MCPESGGTKGKDVEVLVHDMTIPMLCVFS